MNYDLSISNHNIGTYGNVDIQVKNAKNNRIISEYNIHNTVTSAGNINVLNALCLNHSCQITGLRIKYHATTDISNSTTLYKDFSEFSSIRIVPNSGTNDAYAEFKFYLSSESLNENTLVAASLLSRDSTNTLIEFAEVNTSSVIDSTTTSVITSITKTNDISVLYVWRIGLTSAFINEIY